MIVDTSAVLAVLLGEGDAASYAAAIGAAEFCSLSAATFVEISIVAEARGGDAGVRRWEAFFRQARMVVEPVTEEQARAAAEAWSKYGKGRHAAGLNFGDCFSYALSKVSGEPLLFKGADFFNTDVQTAM
jgi:ribonuclease VapC